MDEEKPSTFEKSVSKEIEEIDIREVIQILFNNMRETNESELVIISRKTLIEMSPDNLHLIIQLGVNNIRTLINSMLSSTSNIDSHKENLLNFISLFKEIIEQNGKQFTKKIVGELTSLYRRFYQEFFINSPFKESDKLKQRDEIMILVSDIMIYLEINEDLLQLFQPGIIPKKVLVDLFAKIASTYSNKPLSNYHAVISRIILNLTNINDLSLRVSICKFFSHVCENILFQREERKEVINSEATIEEEIIFLFSTCYDLINGKWINQSQVKSLYIINTIIMMSILMNETIIKNNLDYIVTLFVSNIKNDDLKETHCLAISFRIFLERNLIKFKDKIDNSLINIMMALLSVLTSVNISPNVKDLNETFLNVKSEMGKIFLLIFNSNQEIVYPFLLSRFEQISLLDRLTNIYLLKGIILRTNLISSKDVLLNAVCKALYDNDFEYRFALIELIYVLFEKDLVTREHSIKIIAHLLRESGITDEEIEKTSDLYESYPFYTSLKTVRDKADSVLIELVLKVNKSEVILWPLILEYLVETNVKYSESAFIICEIIPLIKANYLSRNQELTLDYKINNNIPLPNSILIKLFMLLASPLKRNNIYYNILSSLKILLPIIYKDIKLENISTNLLENYLPGKVKSFNYEVYLDILSDVWDSVLDEIKASESLTNLNEHLSDLIPNINKDHNKGLLLRLKGLVLKRISKKEILSESLDMAFNICHPEYMQNKINGMVEPSIPGKEVRNGVGELFGLTSKVNIDLVLEKINSIFKAEITVKRPSGFSALFSKPISPELSPQIIATLILTLGFIAKYCDINQLPFNVQNDLLPKLSLFFREEKKAIKLSCLISLGYIFKALQRVSSAFTEKGEIYLLPERDEFLTSMMIIFRNEKALSEIKVQTLSNISLLIRLDPPVTLDQSRSFVNLAFTIYDNSNFSSLKDKLYNLALEKASNVLESIMTHDVHLNINDKLVEESNFTNVDFYEMILNYDKEYFNSWDSFSFIVEKFYQRFRDCSEELMPILIERIEMLFHSKKSFEFKKEELDNWIAIFLCLFSIMFSEFMENDEINPDDINNYNNSVYTCFAKLLNSTDLRFRKEEKAKFTVELANIISKLLIEKDRFLRFFSMSTYLLKSNSLNVNKYASVFLLKLADLRNTDFKENESDTSQFPKIKDLFQRLINITENYVMQTKLNEVDTNDQFKNVLIILVELSSANTQCLINCLIDETYGLPLSHTFKSLLHKVALEKTLLNNVLHKFIEIINNNEAMIDKKPNFIVMASTLILGTIFEVKDEIVSTSVKKIFPLLFSTLLQRIGNAHSSLVESDQIFIDKDSDPRAQAIWSIIQLIKHSDNVEMKTCLDDGLIHSKLIDNTEYDEAIYELILIYCKKTDFDKQKQFFECLEPFLNNDFDGHRVVSISCVAQLVNFASYHNCKDEKFDIIQWRKKLIDVLTKYLQNENQMIRKMAIRGISNICKLYMDCSLYIENYVKTTENLKQGNFFLKLDEEITDERKIKAKSDLKNQLIKTYYNEDLIKIIVEKLEDKCDMIVLEILNLIEQLLNLLDEPNMSFLIFCLLDKIKPCFDKENYHIRIISISIFNKIISTLPSENLELEENHQQLHDFITKHIHFNLMSLFLHSNDENSTVKNHCLKTLIKGLNVILNTDMTIIFNEAKEKVGDDYNRVYDEFIISSCKLLCDKYPKSISCHINDCLSNITSYQDNIRANSIYIVGVFYKSLLSRKSDAIADIHLKEVFKKSCWLLKDISLKVKLRTVKSLSFFKSIQG